MTRTHIIKFEKVLEENEVVDESICDFFFELMVELFGAEYLLSTYIEIKNDL